MTGLIGVDWGSTRLRAYRLDADGVILDRSEGEDGIKSVPADGYADVLARHIGDWPERTVLLSGMVTSRNGWVETPYAPCPASLDDLVAASVLHQIDDRNLHFLPGVAQTGPDPDVMRGEEMQLLGLPPDDMARLVVLPGTHSKWARLEGDRIVGFRTFMTGELYGLVLHRSLAGQLAEGDANDPAAFEEGARIGLEGGAPVAGMFSLRPRILTGALPSQAGSSFLSGLLVGNEVREALLLLGRPEGAVTLLGAATLSERYVAVLSLAGIAVTMAPPDAAAAGFARAAREI